ncbi:MAG: flp pilus-assembly TadE/G-like family protein [Mycobacteriaceae bacterium]|nr:flp pilus-assembly TadE/G-like family protein [Mycobacteriaceae bacterium]
MAGLIVVTVLVVQFGGVVVARHRAQAAADLAALAAAGSAEYGPTAACDAARTVAGRVNVAVRECHFTDWDAVVSAAAAVPFGLFSDRAVVAVARAGPADP